MTVRLCRADSANGFTLTNEGADRRATKTEASKNKAERFEPLFYRNKNPNYWFLMLYLVLIQHIKVSNYSGKKRIQSFCLSCTKLWLAAHGLVNAKQTAFIMKPQITGCLSLNPLHGTRTNTCNIFYFAWRQYKFKYNCKGIFSIRLCSIALREKNSLCFILSWSR